MLYLNVNYGDKNRAKGGEGRCEFCHRVVHIRCLGGPGRTNPRRVAPDNPDWLVGLISTIKLDSTFDHTCLSDQFSADHSEPRRYSIHRTNVIYGEVAHDRDPAQP